jgi:hypothetical protein
MGKYKALQADLTKLPWSTGSVHTAKCQNCEQHNESMFRRCKSCPYAICSREDCFQTKGFAHFCHGFPPNGDGPYPTLEAESNILATWDAEVPPRRSDLPEPPLHTAGWTPTATDNASTVVAHSRQSIPSLNPPRSRTTPKKKPVTKKSTPSNKTKTITHKTTTPNMATPVVAASSSRKHSIDIMSDDEEVEVGSPEYEPRSVTRSGRKVIRFNSNAPLNPLLISPSRALQLASSPTSAPGTAEPKSRISRDQASHPTVKTPTASTPVKPGTGVAGSGSIALDVRGVDYLTFAPYEGFHVVVPSVNGGEGNGHPELVYRYISSNDMKLHEEPAARIFDTWQPPIQAQAPRTLSGRWRGNMMDDSHLALFQTVIASARRAPAQATVSTPPSTSMAGPSTLEPQDTPVTPIRASPIKSPAQANIARSGSVVRTETQGFPSNSPANFTEAPPTAPVVRTLEPTHEDTTVQSLNDDDDDKTITAPITPRETSSVVKTELIGDVATPSSSRPSE